MISWAATSEPPFASGTPRRCDLIGHWRVACGLGLTTALPSTPHIQIVQHLLQRQDIGIFLIHVEEIHGVSRLMSVEYALLDNHHTEPIGASINNARAHASARALAASNDCINVKSVQVPDQRGAPECAWPGLARTVSPESGFTSSIIS